MEITLTRNFENSYCTMGRLLIETSSWHTVERPWVQGPGLAGARGLSRVPVGRYRIEKHSSESFPNSWALVAPLLGVWHWPWEIPTGTVEGRSTILIHPANYASELAGCIAPGKERGIGAGNRLGVFRSRDAMNEINQILKQRLDIWINITEDFGA